VESKKEEIKKSPWKFVEAFGWPDRFELNQNLLIHLENQRGEANDGQFGLVEMAVREGMGKILPILDPDRNWEYDELMKSISPIVKTKMSPGEVRKLLAWRNGGSTSQEFGLIGDWKKVIRHFTNDEGDYADALFDRLARGRNPNAGHRYLAFLAPNGF
jgi:hypothetical protein